MVKGRDEQQKRALAAIVFNRLLGVNDRISSDG